VLPGGFLDELKARTTLSEIIGRRVALKRAGREYKACCPFHKEKTPSFYINDDKGFYHCFGCGKNGDAVSFLTEHDNLSFMEAVEQLASLAGMEVPKPTPEARREAEREKGLHELFEAATQFYEEKLRAPEGRAGLDYLRGRGLSDETLSRFRLGYAPQGGQGFIAAMKAQGFSFAQLELAGLARDGRDGRGPYSFFRDRVMFPVTDRRGRVVAFGARLMAGDGPKYVNSPENPIFHKGALLYNLAHARRAANEGQGLTVVEGYMDVIAMVQAGYEGAVAPLGTALTEAQIESLWKLLPEDAPPPVLCFDGDAAGMRAAGRAAERALPILKPGLSLRFAFLPQGEDPDSLLRMGGRQLLDTALSSALPLAAMLRRLETGEGRFETPEEKAALETALMTRVAGIQDPSVRNFYREDVKRRLAEAFPSAWELRRRANQSRAGANRGRPGGKITMNRPAPPLPAVRPKEVSIACGLIAAVVNYPPIFEEFGEFLTLLEMPSQGLSRLVGGIATCLGRDSELDDSALKTQLCGLGMEAELAFVIGETTYIHSPFARPGQGLDEVRRDWMVRAEAYSRTHLPAEIGRLAARLAADSTEDNLERLMALARQAGAGNGAEDEEEA
jgi:DNA primase